MSGNTVVRIVDDDAKIRKSLEWLFESVGLGVQSYASAQDFLKAYDATAPGCVVLDVRMSGMSGLDLQDTLQRMNSDIPVILMSAYADVPIAVRAMKAGAVDFLEKPFTEQELLDRVQRAVAKDADNRRRWADKHAIARRIEQLTPREREVLKLVVVGKSSKQIAAELSIAVKTTEAHRSKIMRKMQAESVPRLVLMTLPFLSDELPTAHSRSWPTGKT